MALSEVEQQEIRKIVVETRPEENGIPGALWTLNRVCVETIDKIVKQIWEDECFDEDNYLSDNAVYYDKEDDWE